MDTTALELIVRQTATLGDVAQYPEYTQARILSELNDKLRTVFEDMVIKARNGYWLHELSFTATSGKNRYRIPPRAVVQGLEDVQIAQVGSTNYVSLDQVNVAEFSRWESLTNTQPLVYCVSGDQIEFAPVPRAAYPLKFLYYARPSQLYPSQNSVSGTDRGRIVSISPSFPDLTLNALPFDMSLGVPAAIVSTATSGKRVDIVKPNGWHEVPIVGYTVTVNSPTSVTISSPAGVAIPVSELTDVEVGDYLRVEDQSDWPCLPDDFHRCLCDATAVKLLLELHLTEKAAAIAENNGNDLTRFRSLLYPRVKAAPKMIGIMQRSKGGGWPGGRFFG